MVLSCLPCADMEVSSAAHKAVEISDNHDEKSHNHDKETDLCSPFCVCNCCGQQTLTFLEVQSFQFLVRFQEIKTSISFYKSTSFSNFYGSIWQPPQLV